MAIYIRVHVFSNITNKLLFAILVFFIITGDALAFSWLQSFQNSDSHFFFTRTKFLLFIEFISFVITDQQQKSTKLVRQNKKKSSFLSFYSLIIKHDLKKRM